MIWGFATTFNINTFNKQKRCSAKNTEHRDEFDFEKHVNSTQ